MGRDARGGRLRDGSAGRRALPRGEFPGLPDGRRAACARARLSAADHDSRQVRDEAAEVAYRDKPGGTGVRGILGAAWMVAKRLAQGKLGLFLPANTPFLAPSPDKPRAASSRAGGYSRMGACRTRRRAQSRGLDRRRQKLLLSRAYR